MKTIILILLITVSCALPLCAQSKTESKQTKCTLALDRAPELRGLRLGASQATVLARFPGTSLEKPDKFGLAQLRLTVIDTGAGTRVMRRDRAVEADITSTPGAESAFIIDAAKFPPLKGVRGIRLRFVDGRLAYARVAYDDSVKWDSVDEFVMTVAKALSLPVEWSSPDDSGSASKQRELRCDGFVVTADVSADSTDTRIAAQLSVEDLTATKTVEKRQDDATQKAQQAEDAKRKSFKP